MLKHFRQRLLRSAQSIAYTRLPPAGLTREHVIWAYRLFLDREPENNAVVDEKLGLASTRELRTNFLISSEYFDNNRAIALPDRTTIVIKEFEHGWRLFLDLADQDIGLNIALDRYEPEVQAVVRRVAQPGMVALDIGANIGYVTMLLAHALGPDGQVYAFEPLARNADLLERSIAENEFADRITLFRAAVGDHTGTINLVSPIVATNWGGAMITPAGAVPDGHVAQSVPLLQLDELELRRPIGFMKIDVEGAELLVLRGAQRLLSIDTPPVLAELNPVQLQQVSGCAANQVIDSMAALGYTCYALTSAGLGAPLAEYSAPDIVNVLFVHGEAPTARFRD